MILRRYKPPRFDPKINEPYKAWIRTLPCIVCRQWQLTQARYGLVECAHVGMRGLGQKCHDRETIPLCVHHHRTGPQSHHALGKGFWKYWRLNRYDLIKHYNQHYDAVRSDAA